MSYRLDAASELDLVRNEAIVSSPDDPESPPAEDETPLTRLSIIKAGFEPFFGKIGDSLTYTYLVTNTGGADLTGVTVADDRIASSSIDCNGDAPGTGQPFALAPSDANLRGLLLRGGRGRDRQSVSNVATADSNETGASTDDWTIPLARLAIDKSVTSTGPYVAGSKIEYQIIVENTGSVALTNVAVATRSRIRLLRGRVHAPGARRDARRGGQDHVFRHPHREPGRPRQGVRVERGHGGFGRDP